MRVPFVVRLGVCLLGLSLSACLPEGLRLPQSPLLRSLERKSGLIAYLGSDGNVYTADQAGGNQTALTDDADLTPEGETRLYPYLAWSPRDRRVAYVRVARDTAGVVRASVLVSASDGSQQREIYSSTERAPIYLYWSPDGERVGFLSGSLLGGTSLALHVSSVEQDDSRVVDSGQPYYWAWSPDGQGMLVHVGGTDQENPGAARMAFLSLGEEIVEMGLGIPPATFQAPAFSPDGGHVLFAAQTDEGGEILMLASAKDEARTAAAEVDGPVAFAWSPQGDYVAYAVADPTARVFLGDLSFLDVRDPSRPVIVDADVDRAMAFFWSPQGDRLAIITLEEQGGVQFLALSVIRPGGGEATRVANFRPTRALLEVLPFFDQYQRSSTIWSPDGNYLVFSASTDEGRSGIFVAPSSGAFSPRLVAEGVLGFWSAE